MKLKFDNFFFHFIFVHILQSVNFRLDISLYTLLFLKHKLLKRQKLLKPNHRHLFIAKINKENSKCGKLYSLCFTRLVFYNLTIRPPAAYIKYCSCRECFCFVFVPIFEFKQFCFLFH